MNPSASRLLRACALAGALSPFAFAATADAPARSAAPEPGLLFYLSGNSGATADFSAGGTPQPTYEREIKPIADGARGGALECGDTQLLAFRAPGNIYAQRGTLSFFWRSRYPVGPTQFPVFRVGYADHSSWDMVWLRIDYNGHGFDAFVTDASLSRTRVSSTVQPFPGPKQWTHLAFAWDETRGVRLYVNGQLAGRVDTTARYDAALDQFGPHSRIISPYQVQSDYNFVRGGDIDEVRIYDRMLDDGAIAALAKSDSAGPALAAAPARSLSDRATRDEWWFRYGFNRPSDPPAALPGGQFVSIRKVEITDAYDMARWWWKANDGIRETTWPGVYNRSRLPGRNDYFQLPDWDCYFDSGKAVTFTLPNEPWNHLEIAGAAYGAITRDNGQKLFDRPKGNEHTTHALAQPLTGGKITFTNVEQEQPIGELSAYNVGTAREPAGSRKLAFTLGAAASDNTSLAALKTFIAGRYAPDERTTLVATQVGRGVPAEPSSGGSPRTVAGMSLRSERATAGLPIVHVLVPDSWDDVPDGLDGIALDLPAQKIAAIHDGLVPLNIQVKDPLWPNRDMLDFTCSVKPGEAKTLWLDLRDRILPQGKPLWVTVAAAGDGLSLEGAELRLIFKPRDAARAEHELDRFTQVRDAYAMSTEEHPGNPRLDLYNRIKGDLEDLLRVNPQHELGRQYAAVFLGGPRPAFKQPEAPAGVPLWAFRQVELLRHVQKFVDFYIDVRQSDYGDFGGGISDDVDLLNTWPGVALMGVEPEKIARSEERLLDAAYKNGMFTRGLPTIQADELHSYEEGINCLAQNLIVNFGSPRQLERAMETARGIETITGVNSAGHRHIRTSYYSGSRMAQEEPWDRAKPYSHLVLQVPQLLVDFNGSPAAQKYLLELADGLLAHMKPSTGGRGRGGVGFPTIRFGDDVEVESSRGTFPWHVFWAAYKFTGDKRYLSPLLDGGNALIQQVNANTLDQLDRRDTSGAPAPMSSGDAPTTARGGRAGGGNFRGSSGEHVAWQLDHDKSHLERLYAQQIETCAAMHYINTDGSLWIDRVSVPTAELQRARLGGVALVRNSLYPGHTVSWKFAAPAKGDSVAILIPDATQTAFTVIAYNLEQAPVRAIMTGWDVAPGEWEITQGVDTSNDDKPDNVVGGAARTAKFERSSSLEFTLPPRATTVLTFKLKTPGKPYWQRPDVGLDRQDVQVNGSEVRVRVHSVGAVNAPATTVALRGANGSVLATAAVPALEAPLDLQPRTTEITLRVPANASATGASVVLDPEHKLEEITTVNNAVQL